MIGRTLTALAMLIGLTGPVFAADTPTVPAFIDAGPGPVVTAPALPDPETAPGDTVSLLAKLYHGGAWVGLSILVAFFALSIAAKKVTWLQQDKRAVYCAALVGGLAMLAVPASQGATPNINMIIAAIGAAITLALNPTKPGDAAKVA